MGDGGTIILNASTTSVKGSPAFSIYSSTKAAVRNLARSWALDLKGRGIRVTVVSPGVVPTPGYDTLGQSKEQVQGFMLRGWRHDPGLIHACLIFMPGNGWLWPEEVSSQNTGILTSQTVAKHVSKSRDRREFWRPDKTLSLPITERLGDKAEVDKSSGTV